jgi:hypothetical protein
MLRITQVNAASLAGSGTEWPAPTASRPYTTRASRARTMVPLATASP